MQLVLSLTLKHVMLGSLELVGAFALDKNEVAALLSACGPKKGRTDERCVWLDWRRGELITFDRTIIVRLCHDSDWPHSSRWPNEVAPSPLQVSADMLRATSTASKAKDMIIIGQLDGEVVLTVVEGRRDLEDGDELEPKDGTTVQVLSPPRDLVMTHVRLSALVPRTEALEGERLSTFVWDSRFADTLARVAKAAGKGPALAVTAPLAGGPFLVRVSSSKLDSTNLWDVVAMPLEP